MLICIGITGNMSFLVLENIKYDVVITFSTIEFQIRYAISYFVLIKLFRIVNNHYQQETKVKKPSITEYNMKLEYLLWCFISEEGSDDDDLLQLKIK